VVNDDIFTFINVNGVARRISRPGVHPHPDITNDYIITTNFDSSFEANPVARRGLTSDRYIGLRLENDAPQLDCPGNPKNDRAVGLADGVNN